MNKFIIFGGIAIGALVVVILVTTFADEPVLHSEQEEQEQQEQLDEQEEANGRDSANGQGAQEDISYGSEVSIVGEVACLPHKHTDGPITLECAFGLKYEATGKYYGLKDPSGTGMVFGAIDTGDMVTVTGMLREPDPDQRYDIVAEIDVASIVHVEQ
jgi:hypothetical protein